MPNVSVNAYVPNIIGNCDERQKQPELVSTIADQMSHADERKGRRRAVPRSSPEAAIGMKS